ncbi:MAG: hypothetical protein ACLRIT_07610 [Blautia sp.]
MQGFMTVESSTEQVAYMPMTGFTTVDIGCERGNNSYNMTNRMEAPFSTQYMQLFEKIWNDRSKMQDVTDVVIENISSAYNENSPEFIYFMTLYHVFSEFLGGYFGRCSSQRIYRIQRKQDLEPTLRFPERCCSRNHQQQT